MDLLSKYIVVKFLKFPVIIIPHFFYLIPVRNKAVEYGLFHSFSHDLYIIIGLAILFLLYIIFKVDRKNTLELYGYYLILSGAMGNFIDRIINGAVTDFLTFSFFPYSFNIADTIICIGIGIILLDSFLNFLKKDKENASNSV